MKQTWRGFGPHDLVSVDDIRQSEAEGVVSLHHVPTGAAIPMRPDHWQDILDDLRRQAQPGYPTIGRLRGLAELRGIITALSHPEYRLGQ